MEKKIWLRSGTGRFSSLAFFLVTSLFVLGVFPDARANLVDTYGGQSTLPGFGGAISFTGVTSSADACTALINTKKSLLNASQSFSKGADLVAFTPSTPASGSLCTVIMYDSANNSNSTYTATYNVLQRVQQRKCTKPSGTKIVIRYDPASHAGVRKSMPGTINGYGVDDCAWTQSGIGLYLESTGYWSADYVTNGSTVTGASSPDDANKELPTSSPEGEPTMEDTLSAGGCVAHGGVTICGQQQSNGRCGTVNGEYMCLSTIPDSQCAIGAAGKIAACGDNAGSGVAPPTSAGSVPWDKLGVINSNGEFVPIDLWGKKNGDGSYGVPTQEGGEAVPTDEQQNGVECAANPLKQGCTNKLISGPELSSDVPTFAASMTKFKADFGATPLGEAINISIPDSAGACPGNSTFDFMGSSLSFHSLCDVGDQVLPLLGPVWLAICAWIGFLFVVG